MCLLSILPHRYVAHGLKLPVNTQPAKMYQQLSIHFLRKSTNHSIIPSSTHLHYDALKNITLYYTTLAYTLLHYATLSFTMPHSPTLCRTLLHPPTLFRILLQHTALCKLRQTLPL